MNITILPAEGGDYAPIDVTSIDDINQLRMNIVNISLASADMNIEIHIVEWLVQYSRLLSSCVRGNIISINHDMAFSGAKFIGSCLQNGLISVKMWDIEKKQFTDQVFDKVQAKNLHDTIFTYARRIVEKCGGNWENVIDANEMAVA